MAAIRYLRSTDGSDADSGATWALAKASLAGIDAIDTTGDTIWISQVHAESTAAAVSYTFAGTVASPQQFLCGNDAAEPPTALATTGAISTTGNNGITITATAGYWYGVNFNPGVGAAGSASFVLGNGTYKFDTSNFVLGGATGGTINPTSSSGVYEFVNCGFKVGAAASGFNIAGKTTIRGGSLLAGGTSPTEFIPSWAAGSSILFDGFDFSNASAGLNIAGSIISQARAVLRDCKLPASWSGAPHSGTPGSGSSVEMFNCDSADTHYRYRKAAQTGTIKDETTLVRTGGASDGTTTYSLKMVTNANAKYPQLTLDTYELSEWNDTVGSAITVTVEFLHDSVTALKDNEIWLDVMYLGTSGFPLGNFISDGISVVTTAAAQTASSATWTTTGMANPNKQALAVTFTPQEAGFMHCTVRVAKASYTLYVDPTTTIT